MASARNVVATLERFSKLFKHDLGNVIGVIHVPALPGNITDVVMFYKTSSSVLGKCSMLLLIDVGRHHRVESRRGILWL